MHYPTFTGIGTVNGNTGTVNTGIIDTRSSVSKKRKFPEIHESDSTESNATESNATNALEDIEDVDGNNIINDEQVVSCITFLFFFLYFALIYIIIWPFC